MLTKGKRGKVPDRQAYSNVKLGQPALKLDMPPV